MKKYEFAYTHYNFTFIGETYNTRNGFKHVVNVFCENTYTDTTTECIGGATCYYYNRTWECYNYQTTILKCLRVKIDGAIETLKRVYMTNYNYERMTAKRKANFKLWLDDLQTNQPGARGFWLSALCATYAAFSDGFKAGKHLYNYNGITEDIQPDYGKYKPSYFVR